MVDVPAPPAPEPPPAGRLGLGHGFLKPTHVIYFILIVVGVCLMTTSILDRIVSHYGNTFAYGKVAIWLLILTSFTAIGGGAHIWRIYQQFYIFEEIEDDAEFPGWLNSRWELRLRYVLFIALICALSKADAVFELIASIPKLGQLVGFLPTGLLRTVSEFAVERLRQEHQPENYTIGCAIMFGILIVWSVCAFKIQKAKRPTVFIWIVTDTAGFLFWISCALAVSIKPTDANGNGGVGFFACFFGVGYMLIVLIRFFLGSRWGSHFTTKLLGLNNPESLSRFAL